MMKILKKFIFALGFLVVLGFVSAGGVSAASCKVRILPWWLTEFPIDDTKGYDFEAEVTEVAGGVVGRVDFVLSDPSIFSLTTNRVYVPPYSTRLTLNHVEGVSTLEAHVFINGVDTCSDVLTFPVFKCPYDNDPPNRYVAMVAQYHGEKLEFNPTLTYLLTPRKTLPSPLPIGTYDVTLVSYDYHTPFHDPADEQDYEYWRAILYDGLGNQKETNYISDLPLLNDWLEEKVNDQANGTQLDLETDSFVTVSIAGEHPGNVIPGYTNLPINPDNISSVWPVCAVFEPVSINPATCTVDSGVSAITLAGVGDTAPIIVSASVDAGTGAGTEYVESISIVSSGNVSFNPASVNSSSLLSTVTAEGLDSGSLYTVTATLDTGASCTASAMITVNDVPKWWQAKDGDVLNNGGNIFSNIPGLCSGGVCNPVMITAYDDAGLGITRGIPIAQAGVDWGSGTGANTASCYVINSNNAVTLPTYSEIRQKLSSAVTPNLFLNPVATQTDLVDNGVNYRGYYYSESSGDLTLSGGIDLGTNKVVLFVDGDVSIESTIKLTDGLGAFYLFASGSINVDPAVVAGLQEEAPCKTACIPDLEGFYFAGVSFNSGTNGSDLDNQLHLRGAVIAQNINLERDLDDDSNTPGELFEFAPDLLMQYPVALGNRKIQWREVAP